MPNSRIRAGRWPGFTGQTGLDCASWASWVTPPKSAHPLSHERATIPPVSHRGPARHRGGDSTTNGKPRARPGLGIFGIHENEARTAQLGTPGPALFDAKTGQVLWSDGPRVDVGRGLTANIDPRHLDQPPHPGFHLGHGMKAPPRPKISTSTASASPYQPQAVNTR